MQKVDAGTVIALLSLVVTLTAHFTGNRRNARKDALEELREEFETLKGELSLCRETNRTLMEEKAVLTQKLLNLDPKRA